MAGLIVIQIVPETPVDALKFQKYLTGLQIRVFDLSFATVDSDPPGGQSVGSASYIADSGGWVQTASGQYQLPPLTLPSYPSGITSGIIQQVNQIPPQFIINPAESYQLESVAIAIIEVASSAASGNFRVVVQQGGQTLSAIPYQYDRTLDSVSTPDPATWSTTKNADGNFVSSWAALPVDFYVSVPASATTPLLQLPTDGTPPAFDTLLPVVQGVLASDPGTLSPIPVVGSASAGATTLTLTSVTGITVGMTATGTAIPLGTTVAGIDPSLNQVTLSQELTGTSGASITFAVNLATLSFAQCQNIAYEIIWGQQPPLPSPPDPVEDLYTNPPNNGEMLSGSTPNQYEGGRQQFEGQLQSYYAVADTNADRLTNFVYALAAAVAAEQQSLAATQAALQFPVDPGTGGGSPTETAVILTGVANAGEAGNFGVPAAYFYALAATMPVQVTPAQRYQQATGDQLSRLLTDLTSAFNAGTITDSEKCVTQSAVTISAAQAARRIAALGVPAGSATPLAPLGTVALPVSAEVKEGTSLTFATLPGVGDGMLVSGPGIPPGTTVQSSSGTTVTLTAPVVDDVPAGSVITFTPAYTADLQALVKSWLAYPPPAASGLPSSGTYQPADDASNFWPGAAVANAAAFLDLVLAAVTQGYVIPAPFDVALGTQITTFLAALPGAPSTPTVTTLASVTAEQWTGFFQQNPTWLPPFTQPGNTAARIAAFISAVQNLFPVGTSGPSSAIVLATTAPTASGDTLPFASTTGIVPGMTVTGPGIPPGRTVQAVTPTSVTLTGPVAAGGVSNQANITFAPSVTPASAAASGLPLLQAPSADWLAKCLSHYGAFTFGSGFDLTNLSAAAAFVFADDPAAQAWLVDALVAIDALYQVMNAVAPTTPAQVFSVVEALYARGFRAAADITELDGPNFQDALTGTVAYDSAAEIYAAATAIAPPQPHTPAPGGFKPVNPDGALTDCIPAPCASPLGPIAYLQEMLTVSELSTCDTVVAAPLSLTTVAPAAVGDTVVSFTSAAGVLTGMSASASGIPSGTTVTATTATSVTLSQPLTAAAPTGSSIVFTAPTLGAVLNQRRGPVGDLLASCANLETPLPLINIVNECLEYMGAAAPPANGTVYDTSGDELAGHVLCAEEPCPDDDKAVRCHDPVRLFAALPEYSTPATPVAASAAVEPAAFNKVKADFSSCLLPYSQALDISRTYLRHLGSCRFEEMRTFRKCITEFVLDPVHEPAGFQDWLWRYPVRIDIAIEYLGITSEEYRVVFNGAAAPPCAAPEQTDDDTRPAPGQPPAPAMPRPISPAPPPKAPCHRRSPPRRRAP